MPLRWTRSPALTHPVLIGAVPGGGTSPSWRADLQDPQRAGVGLVICLLEAEELRSLEGAPEPHEHAAAATAPGMRLLHLPTEDPCAPSRAAIDAAVSAIAQASTTSTRTYVRCMAGLGRAGTVAAGLLVRQGMPPGDAIALVRWVRSGAIQFAEQEALIHRLADPLERALPERRPGHRAARPGQQGAAWHPRAQPGCGLDATPLAQALHPAPARAPGHPARPGVQPGCGPGSVAWITPSLVSGIEARIVRRCSTAERPENRVEPRLQVPLPQVFAATRAASTPDRRQAQ